MLRQRLAVHCEAVPVSALNLWRLFGSGVENQRRIVHDPRHDTLLLDELGINEFRGAFRLCLFDSLSDTPAILFARLFLEKPLECNRVVPDIEGAHRPIIDHPLPVAAHGVDRGPRDVAFRQLDMMPGYNHARDQTLEVPLPWRGKGLIEVIDVEHNIA